MARWRQAGLAVTIILVSTLVSLGLAEGAVRMISPQYVWSCRGASDGSHEPGLYALDDALGWRLRASTTCTMSYYRAYTSHVTTNAAGFRDLPRSESRALNVHRIAVFGDSFVAAEQVDDAETPTRILGDALGPTQEVLNFGAGGYSPAQEIRLLAEVVERYHPDLLLFVLYPFNDVHEGFSNSSWSGPRTVPAFVSDVNGSSLSIEDPAAVRPSHKMLDAKIAGDRWLSGSHLYSLTKRELDGALRGAVFGGAPDAWTLDPSVDGPRARLIVDKIAQTSREQGLPLAIVVLPPGRETPAYDAAIGENFTREARLLHLPTLDASSVLGGSALDAPALYAPAPDVHLNPGGDRALGLGMAAFLRDAKLLG